MTLEAVWWKLFVVSFRKDVVAAVKRVQAGTVSQIDSDIGSLNHQCC